MTISDFIEQQLDPIVDEWVAFARTRVPPSHEFTREQLADHARVLLLAIAADMRQAQAAGDRHDKSQGNQAGNAPDLTRTARDHAAQRFEHGFSFEHLVSEFRALRASVLRRWMAQVGQPGRAHLEDSTRFGEAMDQALYESASLYARKVEDSRNLLLGVLGHDLRAPIGVVQMSARYLLAPDTLDGAQTKAVARILSASERMSAMVRDILDFTQTAFGVTLPTTVAAADMQSIAEAIVGEVIALRPDCQVELSVEGDLLGRWDAGRVAQMLSNLLANAAQHGDASQPITVRVRGSGDQVTIRVTNMGTAIASGARSTLFLPLRQPAVAEGERRAGSSGLGLGLYITREIAVAHGGTIEVASDDKSTSFLVTLPRVPPAKVLPVELAVEP